MHVFTLFVVLFAGHIHSVTGGSFTIHTAPLHAIGPIIRR